MNTVASLPDRRGVRWVLRALAWLLAACAVHALAGFDAGPFTWLLQKWGYNVVLVGSGLLCREARRFDARPDVGDHCGIGLEFERDARNFQHTQRSLISLRVGDERSPEPADSRASTDTALIT